MSGVHGRARRLGSPEDLAEAMGVDWVASPNRAAMRTTSLLSTGNTPGKPRSTAQAWVLGAAP